MKRSSNIKISLFSGGSGNERFVNLIKDLPGVELNIIVNGYDDGKSTGEIRNYIPNMLGPSDYRKNLIYLLNENNSNEKILKKLLNFRINNKINKREFINFLNLSKKSNLIKTLELYNLSYEKFVKLREVFSIFRKYYSLNSNLKLSDISVGNILIASFFLKYKNFNRSIEKVHEYLDISKNRVLNVTDGKNLFLVAILENGKIIENEEKLIKYRHTAVVDDIYLIKKKFDSNFLNNLDRKNKISKKKILKQAHIYPKINKDVINCLEKSDIIIYGPGTQYSSLFPSYLTQSLRNIISRSRAKKFLITNIFLDNDIINENVDSIIEKFNYFFNKSFSKKIKNNKLVDYFFINEFDQNDINLLGKENYLTYKNKKKYTLLDWEKGRGLHYPNWLAKSIFKLSSNSKLIKHLKKSVITILVPCLNEKRTIYKVLNKLNNLNLNKFNVVVEIIVIDGGSTDGSINIIGKFKDFKFYKLKNARKGESLKYGIQKSKGDIIIFFPSDNEYEVTDIAKVIEPIFLNQSKVVYGSRMIKSMSLDNELQKIYKNNYFTKNLSKYGGKLINFFIFFLFNKSISDPFTSIKAFDAKILKDLKLKTRGFEMDFEIFVKLYKKKHFFLEVPVKFFPRTRKQGKKITTLDGLKCLLYILFSRFFY